MRAPFSSSLIRQTFRRLVRERGFTTTVVLTLALCIGANVAIFAVIDAILVRSLPYKEPSRLVTLVNSYPGAGAPRSQSSLPNYYDRRAGIAAFSSLSMYQRGDAIVGEAGAPQRIDRDRASGDLFTTLGISLAQGRTFTEDEMLYANAQVAIITDEFWKSYFHGEPKILGRTFLVDNTPHTVIGVLPPKFSFLGSNARFLIPLASNLEDRTIRNRHSNNMNQIARLKPGVSLAEAQAQVEAFNALQLRDDPHAALLVNAGYRTDVFGLHDDTVRTVKPTLLILQGAVLLLLIIGLINLVNLLLIRASARTKELTVRQALGAGWQHLARETLAETLLLAILGGTLGLALGAFGIRLMDTLGVNQMPLGASVGFDLRVALISLAGSIVVGAVLAVPIVIFNLRRDLAQGLQAESRNGTASRGAQRARHVFIVVQIALAFALLCGAGLLGLSLRKVLSAPSGFQPDSVLTASISLPWSNYQKDPERLAFVERLLADVRTIPGVTHAGVATNVPFSGFTSDNATTVEDAKLKEGESIRTHYMGTATDGYWQSLGIPLIEGRMLEDADNHRDQRVCVVDQAFVQRYWPGQSALGKRLTTEPTFNSEIAFTIVGVVGTVKQTDLTEKTSLGSVYLPFKFRSPLGFTLLLRTSQPPQLLRPILQKRILALDPQLPLDDVKVARQLIDDSLVTRRSPAMLAGIFAAVALLLAAVGTYGVLAYAVNQRRREIGVRLALGAAPAQVLRQFLMMGFKLVVGGLLLGLACALVAGKVMERILFDLSGFHSGIAAIAACVLGSVVLLAIWIPARRAALVSPMEAMRD